jgi:hypothetical protein
MQRILAKEPGAGAATAMIALATCLSTMPAADAWSPLETLRASQSEAAANAPNAIPDVQDRSRLRPQHRVWRHVRHHRRHPRPEMEAGTPPPAAPIDVATAPKTMPQPQPSSVASTLQLVLTGTDGGDPFEQLMTAYYWSRLNHAISADQVFEPAQRNTEVVAATETRPSLLHAASLMDKAAGR